MKRFLKLFAVMIISAAMWGCSTQPKVSPNAAGQLPPDNRGSVPYTETGKASFYGDKHQSKKTASGEIYDQHLLTAAHRSIAFGTKVKVTNTENGRDVVVKINDRGPYAKGRVIDLSRAAFDAIASRSSGVVEVKIEVIE
jgi:rare lipoprotein A